MFDTDRRELYRGRSSALSRHRYSTLLDHLIRNRERVVGKADLINAVWNGRSVSDAALKTRLNVARNAIGDSGEEQRLIKTLPRRGFRFVRPVQDVPSPAGGPVAASILAGLSWVKVYACTDTGRAIAHFERAMRLSPRDPDMASMLTGIAFAHLIEGHYETALSLAQQSIDEGPHFTSGHRAKIAALIFLGREPEARGGDRDAFEF